MNPKFMIIVMLAAFHFILPANAFAQEKRFDPQSSVSEYIAEHPDLPKTTIIAMRNFSLREGMSEEQVRATWGTPIKTTTYSDGLTRWKFSCAVPHPCKRKGAPGSRRWVYKTQPTADFVAGRLTHWGR